MNDLEISNNTTFESIKHIDDEGNDFWYARELQKALNYVQWRRFKNVIEKAKTACNLSSVDIGLHFANVGKVLEVGNNAKMEVDDYRLSRYACYLIAQNGDSRKEVIAKAQTYFAVQTRKQELSEKDYSELSEDEKRFYQRNLTKKGNYSLNNVAKNASVKNFD